MNWPQRTRKKRKKGPFAKALAEDTIALEAMHLAAALQKAELEYLRHLGVFEAIRKEGRALKFLEILASASKQFSASSGA